MKIFGQLREPLACLSARERETLEPSLKKKVNCELLSRLILSTKLICCCWSQLLQFLKTALDIFVGFCFMHDY